ncbi:MAG: hypothetical protein C3F11_21340, partial [Methylocystaceae bacterium]
MKESRAIAVEIRVPQGPKFMYALLGSRLCPGGGGRLTVDVHISALTQRVFADSLAQRIDEV